MRARSFVATQQISFIKKFHKQNENGDYVEMSKDEINDVVMAHYQRDFPLYDEWAFIIHDKDVVIRPTGEIEKKPPHIHFYCKNYNPVNNTAIAKFFECNPLSVRETISRNGTLSYMLHHTRQAIKDGKHQYDKSEKICSNSLDFFNWDEIANNEGDITVVEIAMLSDDIHEFWEMFRNSGLMRNGSAECCNSALKTYLTTLDNYASQKIERNRTFIQPYNADVS